MPSKILVLGAGELGLAVLSALADHPQRNDASIAVLLRASSTRTTSRKEFFSENRIAIREVDVVSSSMEDLAVVFREGGYDIAIGCMGMECPSGTQLKIAKAALVAGIRRYFPWQFGVDYDAIGRSSSQNLFTEQLGVRDLLRGQDQMKWCIVSTGMFMSFLFEEAFGVVAKYEKCWKVRGLGGWENKVTVTAVADIGNVVAELVYAEPDVGVYYTAGDTVSYRQLADVVANSGGEKELEREEWDLSTLKKELESDPGNEMKKYRIVFGEGIGVSWNVGRTFNKQRNMKMTRVEDWVRKNMSSY